MNSVELRGIVTPSEHASPRLVQLNGVTMKPSVNALAISPDGYNWGYRGAGPNALAYDLVDRLVPNALKDEFHDQLDQYYTKWIERILDILVENPQSKSFTYTLTEDFLHEHVWRVAKPVKPGVTPEELSLGLEDSE